MPLKHLLHGCPHCGGREVAGDGDRVLCRECGTRFERGRAGATVDVVEPGGRRTRVPAHRLARAVQELSGGDDISSGEGEPPEASARVRRGREEEAIGYRGRLFGFVEVLGEPATATLRLTGEGLEILDGDGRPEEGWSLMDLRAVQSTSSSLQIYTADGELVQFRFDDASPLYWESLLHRALRRAYRESGRGEIVEFQPRISVR